MRQVFHDPYSMAIYEVLSDIRDILPSKWTSVDGILRATHDMYAFGLVYNKTITANNEIKYSAEQSASFENSQPGFPTKGIKWPFASARFPAKIIFEDAKYDIACAYAEPMLLRGMKGNIRFTNIYQASDGFHKDEVVIDHYMNRIKLEWDPKGKPPEFTELEKKIKKM